MALGSVQATLTHGIGGRIEGYILYKDSFLGQAIQDHKTGVKGKGRASLAPTTYHLGSNEISSNLLPSCILNLFQRQLL